jgi:hypothetical protein
MSVSGHETLKELERYTKAANRVRLASNAIAALQAAQRGVMEAKKSDSKLANMVEIVSQSKEEVADPATFSKRGGGEGWIRTNVGLANGFTVRPL